MSDDILIPDIDTIEGKLLKHAADLDYLILDEVVDRQKRLPIARIQFAPIDLMDYLDALDDGDDDEEEDEDEEDEEDLDEDDDDEDEGDDEQERDEDISDQPTVERTRTQAADATEATARTGLAEAAQQREGVDRHTQRMCSAVLLWIHGEVRRIIRNRPICTFRLRMYKPKGVHVASKNFKAENPSYSPPPADEPEGKVAPVPPPPSAVTPPPSQPQPVPDPAQAAPPPPPPPPAPPAAPQPYAPQLPVLAPQQPLVVHAPPVQVILPAPAPAPPPTPVPLRNTPAVAIALGGDGHGQLVYLDPETIPEARVWRALGHATEAFLGTVGRTYEGIIDLQARTVTHQATQLDKSQALVENLAGQLLVARQVQRTDETEQKVDERQLRVREELGKTFLSELGSLGRVLATSKLGVTPELVELGDIVSASPELAEAVRDPSVRALLKDEKTTRELAQLLRLAAHKSNGGSNGTPPQTS